MMTIYYFYKIINDVDNDIYIGSTTDPTQRWYKHKQDTTRGTVLTPKMRGLGNEHFSFHIIEFGEYTEKQDALEREDELMVEYNSMNKYCASSKQKHINKKKYDAKYNSNPENKIKKAKYKKEYSKIYHDKILEQATEYNHRPEVKQRKSEWAKQNHKETYVKGSQSMKTKAYYAANKERLAYNSLTKWELKSFSTRKQFSVLVFQ